MTRLEELIALRTRLDVEIASIVAREGRSVFDVRDRNPIAKCGTDGGYYRHLRRAHTKPCTPCKRAHADAENARNARRSQRRASGAA